MNLSPEVKVQLQELARARTRAPPFAAPVGAHSA
jgi:predicted transcriptional regulator